MTVRTVREVALFFVWVVDIGWRKYDAGLERSVQSRASAGVGNQSELTAMRRGASQSLMGTKGMSRVGGVGRA